VSLLCAPKPITQALAVRVVTDTWKFVSALAGVLVLLASQAALPFVPPVSTPDRRTAIALATSTLPVNVTLLAAVDGLAPIARKIVVRPSLNAVLVCATCTKVSPLPLTDGLRVLVRVITNTKTSSLLPGVHEANVILPVVTVASMGLPEIAIATLHRR